MNISLTKRAADHVKNFMASEDKSIGVRVGIKTTGCSGFMYVVELSDKFNSREEVFDSYGIKIGIETLQHMTLAASECEPPSRRMPEPTGTLPLGRCTPGGRRRAGCTH